MQLKSVVALIAAGALFGGLAAGGCATGSTAEDGAGGQGGVASTGSSVTGSTSAVGTTGSAMVCVPGKQETCPCPGGADGAQACNADGTGYEPCVCPGSTASSSSGGVTSSSSGGSTSSSGSSSSSVSTASASSASASSAVSTGSGGGDPDNCPGQPLVLVGGTVTVNDDTTQYTNDLADYCTNVGQENGGDVVYSVVAATTGPMTITVTPTGFSAVVSVTTGLCDGDVLRSCSWGVNVGTPTTKMVSAVSGTTYYVYVDGWSLSGPFQMTITN